MTKQVSIKINSFQIRFLNKDGGVEETHITNFAMAIYPPVCVYPENVFITIRDRINTAIGENENPYVIEIKTSKGSFLKAGKGVLE